MPIPGTQRTDDFQVARICFPTEQGDLVRKVPFAHLSDVVRVAVRSAEEAAAATGSLESLPTLPVLEWETGLTAEDPIALRLRIAGGGVIAFVLSKNLAASLQAGLGETLDYAPDHRWRPH